MIELTDEVAEVLYNILGVALDKTQGKVYSGAIVKDLCIRCPHCNRKLQPINIDTTAHNFPYKCRRCGKFFTVDI